MTPEERLVQRLLLAVYDYQVEIGEKPQLLVTEGNNSDVEARHKRSPKKLREIVRQIARDRHQ